MDALNSGRIPARLADFLTTGIAMSRGKVTTVPTNPEKELRKFLALPPFIPEGSSVPTHQNAETGTGGQPLKAVPPRPVVFVLSGYYFT